MAAPTLFLSPAERTQLLKDPEAFARRAEAVFTSVLAKLSKAEAAHAAEKLDSERLYNQLERSQSTLRAEHERATAQHEKISAERQGLVDARDAAVAESARLGGELRAAIAEGARAKEAEREAADEKQRLLQLSERKRQQLEATESELAQAHEAVAASKRGSADLEKRVAEAEASAHASEMKVSANHCLPPLSSHPSNPSLPPLPHPGKHPTWPARARQPPCQPGRGVYYTPYRGEYRTAREEGRGRRVIVRT